MYDTEWEAILEINVKCAFNTTNWMNQKNQWNKLLLLSHIQKTKGYWKLCQQRTVYYPIQASNTHFPLTHTSNSTNTSLHFLKTLENCRQNWPTLSSSRVTQFLKVSACKHGQRNRRHNKAFWGHNLKHNYHYSTTYYRSIITGNWSHGTHANKLLCTC